MAAGLLRSRETRVAALVLGVVLAVDAALAALVWAVVAAEQRAALAAALRSAAAPLAVLGVLALAGLALLLLRVLRPWPAAARRLTGDVRLLLGANPAHRLDPAGPPELAELARAVNDLAERRAAAESEVEREVGAARAALEQERNRLAAVVADLTVPVLVCSRGGRVLLYNAAARTLLEDDPALGLGRSVFGIVDRGLITHALDRVRDGATEAPVSTTLRHGRLLQVRLAPIRAGGEAVSGFVLVLDDMTEALQARRSRDELLRGVTESTRSSLASIRAAVETVLDYPDMSPAERREFVDIVRQDAERLGAQVEGWAAEAGALGGDWFLTDMWSEDLLTVLERDLEREAGVRTGLTAGRAQTWLRVDGHALGRALGHLAVRLREHCDVRELSLSLTSSGRHGRLELRWDGAVPDAETFRGWLDEPPAGGAAACGREVVERHDGEIWAGTSRDGSAHVRVLLPVSDAAPRSGADALPPRLPGRPYYDFDLFDHVEEQREWQERALSEVAYTVFDTETTGFAPAQGDQIVSLGAVRVVNGRLLEQEVLDRLVDPGRPVPAASTAVHGITTEQVRGQPPLEEVLPLFARFAEGTVLVGHNVGFDLSFLRAAEERTGVRLVQPVLDTLLLDAAIHPDHEEHSLEAIAARLGVDVLGRHTALGDALLTGEVFVRLLALLQQRGVATVGEALAASRETYQARLDASLYQR